MEGNATPTPALRLRPATAGDADLLMAWRNDPTTVQFSGTRREVTREEHKRWMAAQLDNPDPGLWIADVGGLAVGQVRLQRNGESAEVHIAVAPESRGKGYGGAMILAVLELRPAPGGLQRLTARVHVDNQASLRIFAACDFQRGDTVDDFVLLERSTD